MTVLILVFVLLLIKGIILGSLFMNLKHDVISLHLMNKLLKEDQKKYMQDFQLKMTDKMALLDAKITRVLTELECHKPGKPIVFTAHEKMKENIKQKAGRKPRLKITQLEALVEQPGSYPQTLDKHS